MPGVQELHLAVGRVHLCHEEGDELVRRTGLGDVAVQSFEQCRSDFESIEQQAQRRVHRRDHQRRRHSLS